MTEEVLWNELGEAGMEELVAAFYEGVKKDDLIGPMYPEDDWEGSAERLYLFLCFRFGGDQRYMEKRGHPRLRGRHLPFKIGIKERDRWLDLMGKAVQDQGISSDSEVFLMQFFSQVADFMRNQAESVTSSPAVGGRGVDFRRD